MGNSYTQSDTGYCDINSGDAPIFSIQKMHQTHTHTQTHTLINKTRSPVIIVAKALSSVQTGAL